MKSAINYKLINIALFLIIIFFIYQTQSFWLNIIDIIIKIIRPFIIAFIITYFLYPLVRLLNKKIKKELSVIIIIVITVFIFYILLKITIPLVSKELVVLSNELDVFINNLGFKYDSQLISIINNNFDKLLLKINNYLNSDLISLLSKSLGIIVEIITIIILSIYFLFNYDFIKEKISNYIYQQNIRIYQLFKNINYELSSYINGIGIIMLVEIIEYTIIYYLIGHPNFFLIASLASFTTVIPFFGSIITNFIALITASVISKKLFILTSIIIIVMPIIDSYLIQPKIYKKTNALPPLLTIIIVILGGMIFKIVGIMIAIPIYIIIKNIIKTIRMIIMEKCKN